MIPAHFQVMSRVRNVLKYHPFRGKKIILAGLFLLLIVASVLFRPLNGRPYYLSPNYLTSVRALDGVFNHDASENTDSVFHIGWSKRSLTPDIPVPMAGYGRLSKSEGLTDSLFVKAFFFRYQNRSAVWLTADLMIFPPLLKDRLIDSLRNYGIRSEEIFMTATHTHSSLGGWSKGPAGKFISGTYSEEIMNLLTKQSLSAVLDAKKNASESNVLYRETPAPEGVHNRLFGDETDHRLRFLTFRKKKTGKEALLITYSAHPTAVPGGSMSLSADYPGVLCQELEKEPETEMAAFAAGAVGSHAPSFPNKKSGLPKWEALGLYLAKKVRDAKCKEADTLKCGLDISVIPFQTGKRRMRITDNLMLNPWVFDRLLPERPLDIRFLKIGNVVMAGLPADFSGLLYEDFYLLSKRLDIRLMIHSFNGEYIGYITPDRYYNLNKPEVREMNWIGPHKGAFTVSLMKEALKKMVDTPK